MKKVYLTKLIQLLCLILGVVLGIKHNILLALVFIFLSSIITFALPLKFRGSFFSNQSGLFLKKRSIKFETILETTILVVAVLYVLFIY